MHLLVPCHDPSLSADPLLMACEMTAPGDAITVLSATIVSPGMVPERTACAGDQPAEHADGWSHASHAERAKRWHCPEGVTLHRVRVCCDDFASVAVTHAKVCGAGAILLSMADPLRRRLVIRLGGAGMVVRRGAGNVRVLSYTVPFVSGIARSPHAATVLPAMYRGATDE